MNPIEFKGCNVVYAKDQKEYLPLPAQKEEDGTVITLWELSPEERALIAKGANIHVSMMTFNQPLQPIRPYVSDIKITDRYFRTPQQLEHDGDVEKCNESYNKMVELLKNENSEHLVEMVAKLIEKNGASATWPNFSFETKVDAEYADVFAQAFEYLEWFHKQ